MAVVRIDKWVFPATKCEEELFKKHPEIAQKFKRCYKKVEARNIEKRCTPEDIKYRRRGCVTPDAVCRVSVTAQYCPIKGWEIRRKY